MCIKESIVCAQDFCTVFVSYLSSYLVLSSTVMQLQIIQRWVYHVNTFSLCHYYWRTLAYVFSELKRSFLQHAMKNRSSLLIIVCFFRYIVPGKNELELGRVRTSQGFDNPVYDTPYDDNFVVSFDPSQDEVICLISALKMSYFLKCEQKINFYFINLLWHTW